MDKENGLLKKTAIYAIGTFGSKILTFLLVPLYSYYLNKEEFGYFDLVITGINLLIPFLTLQVSDSTFRWLLTSEGDEKKISSTLSNSVLVLLTGIFLTILISIGIYAFKPIQNQFLVTLVCINAMIYPYMQQVVRGFGKSKAFALNGLLYTGIYLVSNILLLIVLKLSVEALFYSILIAYFLCSCVLFFQVGFHKRFKLSLISFRSISDLLLYSLPLVPNTISWWLINSANKYIILYSLGIGANGLFAMSSRFAAVVVMINQVFTLAWQETAILEFGNKEKNVDYRGILENLIRVQFTLIILLTLLSQFVVDNLLSVEYYESWRYMPVLYLSVTFLSLAGYYGAIYLGAKKTKEIFTTTIYGSVINIVAAILLVKYIGLMGIAISTTVGYAFLFVLRAFKTRKLLSFEFPLYVFSKYMIFTAVSFAIAYQSKVTVSLIAFVIFTIILSVDNRKILKGLYSKLAFKKYGN